MNFYKEILNILEEGKKGALAIIVASKGSTPRKKGAKMFIDEEGKILGTIGGGKIEAIVCEAAAKIIQREEPEILHFDLRGDDPVENISICGGSMDVYIEPIIPPTTAYIFGGGHISLFLARLCRMVGFEVVVVDDRTEFANTERFPDAGRVIAEEFPEALRKIKVSPGAFLIIVTRGHLQDEIVLEWAVQTEAKYVGMIGSRKKIQNIFANLRGRGIPQERLNRVHAPIGIDIGAETPEEIAVSITAEMIAVKRKG